MAADMGRPQGGEALFAAALIFAFWHFRPPPWGRLILARYGSAHGCLTKSKRIWVGHRVIFAVKKTDMGGPQGHFCSKKADMGRPRGQNCMPMQIRVGCGYGSATRWRCISAHIRPIFRGDDDPSQKFLKNLTLPWLINQYF